MGETATWGKQRHMGNNDMGETATHGGNNGMGNSRKSGTVGHGETAARAEQQPHTGNNSNTGETATWGKQRHHGNSDTGETATRGKQQQALSQGNPRGIQTTQ
ncbi:hypothetical protein ACOMHN_032487 [Nucella lapillus]